MGSAYASVTVRMLETCRSRRDEEGLVFLGEGESPTERLTWGVIEQRARIIAARLRQAGIRTGQRVLLVEATGPVFIVAFFGCLLAGVVPVPAPLPDPTRMARTVARLSAILRDAEVSAVASAHPEVGVLVGAGPAGRGVPWVNTLVTDLEPAPDEPVHEPHADELAFIQYTSGSTSEPRGIGILHRNLASNVRAMSSVAGLSVGETVVSWLPHSHDMGLIGMILAPMVSGVRLVFMPPWAFLQRPLRWLEAIGTYGGAHSAAPNFALALCARRAAANLPNGLDLRGVRSIFVGSEPIRPATLRAFVATFAPAGLDPGALVPSYGLAEATLMVSGGPRGLGLGTVWVSRTALAAGHVEKLEPGAPGARELASSGRIAPDVSVEVLGADGAPCPEGRVGELRVSGGGIAAGYWSPEGGGFVPMSVVPGAVDTGDLGFLLDGELFVVGRVKDVIIVAGRNHAPQDIEQTVEECHPGVRPGCVVAHAMDDEREEVLGLVFEARDGTDPSAIIERVCRAVSLEHGLAVARIVVLPAGGVAKTASGKVRRRATREAVDRGEVSAMFCWTPRSAARVSDHPAEGA